MLVARRVARVRKAHRYVLHSGAVQIRLPGVGGVLHLKRRVVRLTGEADVPQGEDRRSRHRAVVLEDLRPGWLAQHEHGVIGRRERWHHEAPGRVGALQAAADQDRDVRHRPVPDVDDDRSGDRWQRRGGGRDERRPVCCVRRRAGIGWQKILRHGGMRRSPAGGTKGHEDDEPRTPPHETVLGASSVPPVTA